MIVKPESKKIEKGDFGNSDSARKPIKVTRSHVSLNRFLLISFCPNEQNLGTIADKFLKGFVLF